MTANVQYLKLTQQKAEDIDRILWVAVNNNKNQVSMGQLDISEDRFTTTYIEHLVMLMNKYDPNFLLIDTNSAYFCATSNTEEFLKDGGFVDIFEKEKFRAEKEKIDFTNAKRISKTYWWTFGIAVVGFLISVYLLILKIIGQSD